MTKPIAAALCLLLTVAPALRAAEMTGGITGFVLDSARKPVPGMTVRVTDVVDPSKFYTAVTDRAGAFAVGQIPSGSYLVSADTLNSPWIQKDDSPIVEVSSTSTPEVTLVLVKAAELMPAKPAKDGDAWDLLHTILLGSSLLGFAGLGIALVQLEDVESDLDKAHRENRDALGEIRELQREVGELREEVKELREFVGSELR